jgi:hypothetical protein
MRSSSDLALWLLSAAIGVLGILILFTLGVPGVVLLFAAAVVRLRSEARRSLRIGGALAGFGGALLLILAAANARCAELSAPPDPSCTAPDVTVTSVAATALLVLGLALTLRAWSMRSA